MTATVPDRRPHAALELDGRYRKGLKIERLLGLPATRSSFRLLEVGAGSGGISAYFANHPLRRFEVDAVDVVDNRQVVEGFRFTLVQGTALPFDDESFDIVVSNHVIEHVGSDEEQDRHLFELHRVMRPGAVGYLAMPSRWMLVEPHFRLAFLSWWPEGWRSTWLRMWRRGDYYDCRPMSCHDLERRLVGAGFDFEQLLGDAVQAVFEIEAPESVLWKHCLRHVPDFAWKAVRYAFPTLIYRIQKA